MIYPCDLQDLIASWGSRAKTVGYTDDYKEALAECAFELETILSNSNREEEIVKEAYQEMLAQDYLGSLEAHQN